MLFYFCLWPGVLLGHFLVQSTQFPYNGAIFIISLGPKLDLPCFSQLFAPKVKIFAKVKILTFGGFTLFLWSKIHFCIAKILTLEANSRETQGKSALGRFPLGPKHDLPHFYEIKATSVYFEKQNSEVYRSGFYLIF